MDLSNITILLVEDEPLFRKQTIDLLKKFRFKDVYEATDGEDALEKYTRYLPDIILTDYNMPIVNGLDMSIKLKNINPELPIILLTASDDNNTIVNAINVGIDGYIFKPIKLKELTSIIEKHAKRILLKKELKKEQKLLQEYKGVIDVSAAVTKTDKNGVITYVNESFCEMCGYSQDELIGKNHNIVKDPENPKGIYSDMWSTITNKNVWKGRMRNLRKDGNVYYEHSVIVPIVNEDGDIQEYISLRHDITDLYIQEQHLRKRIEKEVDKNLELHKKREEENLLETKFSTIGRMAAGITHEINTPLTYVRGNLELMMQDIKNLDDSVEQKPFLQEDSLTLLDGINRIAYTVESMREIASQTEEVPKQNNLYSSLITALTLSHNKAKFISQIMLQGELFKPGMDKNRYKFNAEIQSQRIEQVFIIIINNAFDALQNIDNFDDRLLEINIKESEKHVTVVFKDNGGGIDEKILPKIFDPFQSDKAKGGIGIGLNVAKRIIDDHKGMIIPSNHKDGAQFNVLIQKTGKRI